VQSVDREQKSVTVVNHQTGETYQQRYDKLILAPGASPLVPPIEGAEAPNVFTLRNVDDTDRIKAWVDQAGVREAAVIGAGYIGLEMVEQLVNLGLRTSLAELQPQVLPLMDPEMAQPLESMLADKEVALFLGDGIQRVVLDEAGQAKGVELNSGIVVDADVVILGIGVQPNVSLAAAAGLEIGAGGGIAANAFMQTNDRDIYAVGDAAEYAFGPTGASMRIPLAGPANRAGRLAGEHAATGEAQPLAPVFGTSIVRAFDVSAGLTGLTAKLAAKLNVPTHSVTIVANQHAGYYPGASPLTLKLLYAPETGKVLGAQVVGRDGVDKRLDVLATAMAMNATVYDLAGLDLAYAPPFGSAKDPIHLAAFAACNHLDGLTEFVDAAADLSGKQVVDVRTVGEVEKTPLAGVANAVNIPVDELRDRLDELFPNVETIVSCGVGLRAHVAARILAQCGFDDVKNLSGGATVRNRSVAQE
jgi:NADPH-dependent 2,4-dienoyl-CoA reductase/sulfur reductase-like enzyme/rhodanese-related sulfurtransferase